MTLTTNLICRIPLTLVTTEKIILTDLSTNPGILPSKLGTAKIQEYTRTLIHYYDLTPIINELNRLNEQTISLKSTLDYKFKSESTNYLKILNLIQSKVETKIKEILPHPNRSKRGLINGIGSIFKAVTGNLDASDGERYDQIISKLERNQNQLKNSIINQNSLSIKIIENFNKTILNIMHHEILIQSRLMQIAEIIKHSNFDKYQTIKNVFDQLINMYEIINSILQDIENAITFSKLKVMHPSIIKTSDLLNELKIMSKEVNADQLPEEIIIENIILLERLIEIDCYISNNRIVFLLHFPIVYPTVFSYYHLYPLPVKTKSQYKTIIPNKNLVLINKAYFAYMDNECKAIQRSNYVCPQTRLQEVKEDNPCEIQIMLMKNISNCQQTNVAVTKPLLFWIKDTNLWIGIFPTPQLIKLKCIDQEEIVNVDGTHLMTIPEHCQVSTKYETVYNKHRIINKHQPMLLPNINGLPKIKSTNLTLHLQDINLDGLQQIKNQIQENVPQLETPSYISTYPSAWTILLYISILICIGVFLCFKFKCLPRKKPSSQKDHGQSENSRSTRMANIPLVDLAKVQLP